MRTARGTGQNRGLGTWQRALPPGWLSCPAGLGSFFFRILGLGWADVSPPKQRNLPLLPESCGWLCCLRFHTQHLLSPHVVLHFPQKSTCSICFIGKPGSSPLKTESAENPLTMEGSGRDRLPANGQVRRSLLKTFTGRVQVRVPWF